jgi:hypothetical protein
MAAAADPSPPTKLTKPVAPAPKQSRCVQHLFYSRKPLTKRGSLYPSRSPPITPPLGNLSVSMSHGHEEDFRSTLAAHYDAAAAAAAAAAVADFVASIHAAVNFTLTLLRAGPRRRRLSPP